MLNSEERDKRLVVEERRMRGTAEGSFVLILDPFICIWPTHIFADGCVTLLARSLHHLNHLSHLCEHRSIFTSVCRSPPRGVLAKHNE